MRSMTVLALLAGAAALTQAASAAAPNAPVKSPAPVTTLAQPAPPPNKLAGCEKTWRDQGPKKHTGKHKAFIAACMAKG